MNTDDVCILGFVQENYLIDRLATNYGSENKKQLNHTDRKRRTMIQYYVHVLNH